MSTPFTMTVPLDRVTALVIEPGGRFELHGLMTAGLDGATFDAARLFDFGAGGLRLVDTPGAHVYQVEATGETAAACASLGVPSPCLVPRLNEIAQERLATVAELAPTLSGHIELESHAAPAAAASAILGTALGVGVVLAAAVFVAIAVSRRMGRSALGRVLRAARRARRAARGDGTLAAMRKPIRALVDRARHVDAARRACARKLARIDRAALERRVDALLRSSAKNGAAALAIVHAERAEVTRLEGEHAAAVVELERIESALRVATLRAGTLSLAVRVDPVEVLVSELELRDQAVAEADAP
jgi:hypothetical protein